jgi:hypothetical protein
VASFLTFEVESDLLKGFDTVLTGNHGQFAHTTAKSASKRSSGTAIPSSFNASMYA